MALGYLDGQRPGLSRGISAPPPPTPTPASRETIRGLILQDRPPTVTHFTDGSTRVRTHAKFRQPE